MQVQGINHITFSVSNMAQSVAFYQRVLRAKLLFHEGATAYLDAGGAWIALNEQPAIPRNEIRASYTHIAFTISPSDREDWEAHFANEGVPVLPGRARTPEEGLSFYFYDPDGHLLELHAGSLAERLAAYCAESAAPANTV